MKSYIIPIFIPHYGCQHNCVFCNQKRITGQITPVMPEDVHRIINEHLAFINRPFHIEVAFYGGSFTALPKAMQTQLLYPAFQFLQQQRIHGIRLSTRPDCITEDILDNLLSLGVSTIELGVQSLDDKVLAASERGHTRQHVFDAVPKIKKAGFACGIQIMPGLPGEDWHSFINTAQQAVALSPDMMRIYPTLVIADTKLAELYTQQTYQPLSIKEAIRRSAYLKLLCEERKIKVIRTGLQATSELSNQDIVLAGPYHPAFGEMVAAYIFLCMTEQLLENLYPQQIPDILSLHYYAKDHSKLRGIGNDNLKQLRQKYGIKQFELIPDGFVPGELRVEHQETSYLVNQSLLLL